MHLELFSSSTPTVAEIQGLYGPFSFPEKLLQKIWLRADFAVERAATIEGLPVRVIRPGKWNLLGGPDFKDACIRVGTTTMTGDVEVHLRASDWMNHRHADDPAYNQVILHVVLFPGAERITRGALGREIPVLSLLPLLRHDLEEYAADDAVERLADHPLARAEEDFLALSEPELRRELLRQSELRWEKKVHFARVRVERLGWEEACHHAALEILGFRFNRAPMLSIASKYPLRDWSGDKAEELAERIFQEEHLRWSFQGVRPANQPRIRLGQYQRWARARPDWPTRWATLAKSLSAGSEAADPVLRTSEFRKAAQVSKLREAWSAELTASTVGGSRWDNLLCDGFLPLAATRQAENVSYLALLWRHWYVGDAPERFVTLLRNLGVFAAKTHPASHGFFQGFLGWLLEREQQQSTCDSSSSGAGLDKVSGQKLR